MNGLHPESEKLAALRKARDDAFVRLQAAQVEMLHVKSRVNSAYNDYKDATTDLRNEMRKCGLPWIAPAGQREGAEF